MQDIFNQQKLWVMSSKNLEGIFLWDHKNGWKKWLWNTTPRIRLLSCWEWTHGTYINRKVTKWAAKKKQQSDTFSLNPGCLIGILSMVYWLVLSTHLKNISQIGKLPQIGVKIKNVWNHHLVNEWKLSNQTSDIIDPQRWAIYSHVKHCFKKLDFFPIGFSHVWPTFTNMNGWCLWQM